MKGLSHITFIVRDLDRMAAFLHSLGVEVEAPRCRIDGEGQSLYFHDFENHLFELHTAPWSSVLRLTAPEANNSFTPQPLSARLYPGVRHSDQESNISAPKSLNSPAIRKSKVVAMAKNRVRRVSTAARCTVAWFATPMLLIVATAAFAQSACPGIHVNILNIRNSTGTVACALFESPEGFPYEYLNSATNVMVIKIRKAQARCDFEDIPPGTYAMAVVHDENMNGKLDTNWLGVPREGYGFSNDAKAGLSAPPFSDASFTYDGRSIDLTMTLHY